MTAHVCCENLDLVWLFHGLLGLVFKPHPLG